MSIRIKPLEWVEISGEGVRPSWYANALGYVYLISPGTDEYKGFHVSFNGGFTWEHTLNEAKRSAEIDLEKRILPSLFEEDL